MRTPSFKIKLLLSMMLVVVGVTGATSYISQKKFQETYQKQFDENFQTKTDSFIEIQNFLMNNFKGMGDKLVGLPRLQAALEEASGADGTADRVYGHAKAELLARQVLGLDTASSNTLHVTFFLFMDAAGKVIVPPESFSEARRLIEQPRLKKQLEVVGHAIPDLNQSIIGYITPENERGELELELAVVTRVVQTVSGETLGALVLGFRRPNLGASAGLFFESRLFSESIPDNQRKGLTEKLSDYVGRYKSPPENFIHPLNDKPHRVFYKRLNLDSHFPMAYLVALISIEKMLEDKRDLRMRILLFSGVGFIGAFAVSVLLSHGLSVPIRELVRGTAEIQRGNFEVKVPVRSRDEIGHLAESFNEMAVGLALKEKYRSFLNMVADKKVAEEMINGKIVLGGETRDISVLFCDIRGFTPLTQGMDPKEVIRMLNEHMTILTKVVYENQGFVDKFVGDLIMAVFGAPKSYGSDALNATRCGLEMVRQRTRLNETSQYKIHIGIGVASGPAVAGNMGSVDRSNYTVLGERVNLASRLCGKAGRMDVVIDETTRQRLGEAVQVEAMPELELKGFSFRVTAYKVLDIRPVPV